MSRIRWGFLAAAVVLGLLAGNAVASPPPWAQAAGKPTTTTVPGQTTTTRKPPRSTTTTLAATTTTLAATTTTAQPTTTTLAATTTSTVMPTTTVTMGGCQAPLTISSGGVYSLGCRESTSVGTPAITINTTQPVTIDRMTIKHRGIGISYNVSGVNLTVTNSTFERTSPGTTTTGQNGRAINLTGAASLVVEHNTFLRGNGIWVGNTGSLAGRVRYNYSEDIGYWGLSDCCVQFFQSDGLTLSGVGGGSFEIGWNHTLNRWGQSDVEDNINIYKTGGASGSPLDIHHNLIDGAYDASANGDGYTGGGILFGDGNPAAGSWVTVRDNWIIGTSNYGVSSAGGSNNQILRNTAVSDSLTQTGGLHSPTYGTGVVAWDSTSTSTNITVQDNVSGWVRRTGVGTNTERSDYWLPEADVNTGNTSMADPIDSTDEQAARDAWDTARVAAGVTVGPLP